MLILTRCAKEKIYLYTEEGEIELTVLGCDGEVRLGFDAPKSIIIKREEIRGNK